ncbi:hypothetical protein QBC46DRAFT_421512 [Diplogelasinospora grovesii]|uniref:Uncharacterized protein n=1 Tax=Diplogelasinospora grovesii TaxID=303347 RepID=A0AAN6NGE7_9PEZI|nr:hypothetical protein QBC46DRAFT_421512 [Diplogelasinospora grovesii]
MSQNFNPMNLGLLGSRPTMPTMSRFPVRGGQPAGLPMMYPLPGIDTFPPGKLRKAFELIDNMLLHEKRFGVLPPPGLVVDADGRHRDLAVSILQWLHNCGPDFNAHKHAVEMINQLRPPRIDLERHLENTDHQWQGLIDSIEHCREIKSEYVKYHDKAPSPRAPMPKDFPHNNWAKQKELAKELFDAIVDFSEITDGKRADPKKPKNVKIKKEEDEDAEGKLSLFPTLAPFYYSRILEIDDDAKGENAEEKGKAKAQTSSKGKGKQSEAEKAEPSEEGEDQDGSASPVFKENHHVQRVRKLSNIEVEILAWELLYTIKEVQEGRYNIGKWTYDWRHDNYDTFLDRFLDVLDACKKSKAVVHGMLTANFASRIASAPFTEFHRKVTNKEINSQRDLQVKVAIKVLGGDLGLQVTENLGLQDATGKVVIPAADLPPVLKQARANIKRRIDESIEQRVTRKRRATKAAKAAKEEDDSSDAGPANPEAAQPANRSRRKSNRGNRKKSGSATTRGQAPAPEAATPPDSPTGSPAAPTEDPLLASPESTVTSNFGSLSGTPTLSPELTLPGNGGMMLHPLPLPMHHHMSSMQHQQLQPQTAYSDNISNEAIMARNRQLQLDWVQQRRLAEMDQQLQFSHFGAGSHALDTSGPPQGLALPPRAESPFRPQLQLQGQRPLSAVEMAQVQYRAQQSKVRSQGQGSTSDSSGPDHIYGAGLHNDADPFHTSFNQSFTTQSFGPRFTPNLAASFSSSLGEEEDEELS